MNKKYILTAVVIMLVSQGDTINLNLLAADENGYAVRKADGAPVGVKDPESGNTYSVIMHPAAETGDPLAYYISPKGRVCRYTVNGQQKGAAAGSVRGPSTTTKGSFILPAQLFVDTEFPKTVPAESDDETKAAVRKANAAHLLQMFSRLPITVPGEPEKAVEIPLTEEEIEKATNKMKRADMVKFLMNPANLVRTEVIPARPAGQTTIAELAKQGDVELSPQIVSKWLEAARDALTNQFRDAVRLVEIKEETEAETTA